MALAPWTAAYTLDHAQRLLAPFGGIIRVPRKRFHACQLRPSILDTGVAPQFGVPTQGDTSGIAAPHNSSLLLNTPESAAAVCKGFPMVLFVRGEQAFLCEENKPFCGAHVHKSVSNLCATRANSSRHAHKAASRSCERWQHTIRCQLPGGVDGIPSAAKGTLGRRAQFQIQDR